MMQAQGLHRKLFNLKLWVLFLILLSGWKSGSVYFTLLVDHM